MVKRYEVVKNVFSAWIDDTKDSGYFSLIANLFTCLLFGVVTCHMQYVKCILTVLSKYPAVSAVVGRCWLFL